MPKVEDFYRGTTCTFFILYAISCHISYLYVHTCFPDTLSNTLSYYLPYILFIMVFRRYNHSSFSDVRLVSLLHLYLRYLILHMPLFGAFLIKGIKENDVAQLTGERTRLARAREDASNVGRWIPWWVSLSIFVVTCIFFFLFCHKLIVCCCWRCEEGIILQIHPSTGERQLRHLWSPLCSYDTLSYDFYVTNFFLNDFFRYNYWSGAGAGLKAFC